MGADGAIMILCYAGVLSLIGEKVMEKKKLLEKTKLLASKLSVNQLIKLQKELKEVRYS